MKGTGILVGANVGNTRIETFLEVGSTLDGRKELILRKDLAEKLGFKVTIE